MLELQGAIPVYVRQKVASDIKNLQPQYDKNRSLRPQVIAMKNMFLKEGRMTPAQIEKLTNEQVIVKTFLSYINATQDLIDCAILMTIYSKAVGGAEHVTLVFNRSQGMATLKNGKKIQGPMMTCILCGEHPATAGAYVPDFGQPSETPAYVYLMDGREHRPPTGAIHDEELRKKVFARLEKAEKNTK